MFDDCLSFASQPRSRRRRNVVVGKYGIHGCYGREQGRHWETDGHLPGWQTFAEVNKLHIGIFHGPGLFVQGCRSSVVEQGFRL
jgi:hypothetical protein